MKQGGPPNIGP